MIWNFSFVKFSTSLFIIITIENKDRNSKKKNTTLQSDHWSFSHYFDQFALAVVKGQAKETRHELNWFDHGYPRFQC